MGATIVEALAASGAARGAILDLAEALHGTPPAGWSEVAVDLRDSASVTDAHRQVAEHLGAVDIVVLCAGVVPRWAGVEDLDVDVWDDVFAVNVRGMFLTIQGLAPVVQRGGSIVAIGSDNSWRGNRHLASYAASKHAVLGLVRSAALELGDRLIRVNAVAPGPIATAAHLERMGRRERELGIPVESAVRAASEQSALGRMATANEVAAAVVFLASDLSSGIDGQVLRVDAGVL